MKISPFSFPSGTRASVLPLESFLFRNLGKKHIFCGNRIPQISVAHKRAVTQANFQGNFTTSAIIVWIFRFWFSPKRNLFQPSVQRFSPETFHVFVICLCTLILISGLLIGQILTAQAAGSRGEH